MEAPMSPLASPAFLRAILAQPHGLVEGVIPPPMLRPGPFGLAWWQVLGVPVALALAAALGWSLGWVVRRVLGHAFSRTATGWDDLLLARLAGPITALCATATWTALSPALELPPRAAAPLSTATRVAVSLVLLWGALRAVDLAFQFAAATPWARSQGAAGALVPLGRKASKIALASVGAIAVLTELGYPAASLLAGLGIGGLALALAAQKTVENLFGSVAISVDQPFRVGDAVRVDGVLGTVESVGLRSTRIRTLDRSLVSLPNGKLADMRTETLAARDRIRLAATVPLVYSTTASQLRAVLAGIEEALRAQPLLDPEGMRARFVALGASSLDVEVMAWFRTTDPLAFLEIQQEVLLAVLEVVERSGTALAFPTRTVHLAGKG
jgi:MscS family membrane protein